jgi:phosphoribosyl-ATP pyrophosphohydrolase
MMTTPDIFCRLQKVLVARKAVDNGSSYVAGLYAKGVDGIGRKVVEEAVEVLLAAKTQDSKQLVHELADLWFHTLVLLSYLGVDYQEVLEELERRQGVSGLEEKAARGNTHES